MITIETALFIETFNSSSAESITDTELFVFNTKQEAREWLKSYHFDEDEIIIDCHPYLYDLIY